MGPEAIGCCQGGEARVDAQEQGFALLIGSEQATPDDQELTSSGLFDGEQGPEEEEPSFAQLRSHEHVRRPGVLAAAGLALALTLALAADAGRRRFGASAGLPGRHATDAGPVFRMVSAAALKASDAATGEKGSGAANGNVDLAQSVFDAVAGDIADRADVRYWQVVQDYVNVRKVTSSLGEILGYKEKCDVVAGVEEDGPIEDERWVRLIGEPGFMMESTQDMQLLEKIVFVQLAIPGLTCDGIGRHTITSVKTCQAAARAAGLQSTNVRFSSEADIPEGCFVYHSSYPVLSTGKGGGSDPFAEPLCSSLGPCVPHASRRPGQASTEANATTAKEVKSTTSAEAKTTTSEEAKANPAEVKHKPSEMAKTTIEEAQTTLTSQEAKTTVSTTSEEGAAASSVETNTSEEATNIAATTTADTTTSEETTTIDATTTLETTTSEETTTIAATTTFETTTPEETTTAVTTTVATTTLWPKHSMFCFLVAMADGSERDLVEFGKARGTNVFACEEHLLITDVEVEVGEGEESEKTIAVGSLECPLGEWGSWANAEVFLKGWRAVIDDGRFWDHDWVVKTDADTIFYPERFKWHVDKLEIPTGDVSFFQNFYDGYPVVGALEVASANAIALFGIEHAHDCDDLAEGAAEDFWFWKCMDRIGAIMHQDGELLKHEDHPPEDKCPDGWFVAMHPYKTVDEYDACFSQKPPPEE